MKKAHAVLVGLLFGCSAVFGAERPNVVFIVSEDNSMHYLRHFFFRRTSKYGGT